jgi:hypothetical protein
MASWFLRLTNTLQGRTTTFLVMFFVIGNILVFIGKVDFILFFTAFMTAVIGHSVKEGLIDDDKKSDPPASPEQKGRKAARSFRLSGSL